MAQARSGASRVTLTVLGSGTSSGVPLIGCKCSVCRSKNPQYKRTRASVWVQAHSKSFLIDTSTDLRLQALREKILRVDAVLYTHPHADHIYGIDDMRAFNFLQGAAIPIYGNRWTMDDLHRRFDYILNPQGPSEGGGIARLVPHLFDAQEKSLDIQGVKVIPIALKHGSRECVAYRIGSVAYVTDCSYIPPQSLDRLRDLEVLVLDCLRVAPRHGTHFVLSDALDVVAQVRPKRTFFTHMGHEVDALKLGKKLPRGVAFAYDGLKIQAHM